jgi:hypothetical protein
MVCFFNFADRIIGNGADYGCPHELITVLQAVIVLVVVAGRGILN